MPSVDNGNYAGCIEGSAVDVGTQCIVSCDTNYSPSTASVSCISAGSLDQLPECTAGIAKKSEIEYMPVC